MPIGGVGGGAGIKALDICVTRNALFVMTSFLKQSYKDEKVRVNFIFHDCRVISVNDIDDLVN